MSNVDDVVNKHLKHIDELYEPDEPPPDICKCGRKINNNLSRKINNRKVVNVVCSICKQKKRW